MSPDAWTHDIALLPTEQDRTIQVQLFRDYQNNIDAYPRWQAFLREREPPLLVLWGERDPAFIAAGARAYLRDAPRGPATPAGRGSLRGGGTPGGGRAVPHRVR